ncbi:heterokaryon incompatibility protein-domain-containing protein [Colletotrichum lupini]|nr:heterokaryon incompatibility protein-domain-containing protein [Colletotrichum lupini]
MAQTEIFQCQADHACFPIGEVELPTRLVDLSNHANNLITIKNTAEVGKNPKYAALSYCWGKSNTFTITSATLADRQQGFSPSALPLSLQDALRVAQGLHMQYIWIDALCILQDSDEDWLYESARMASIYKNSFITIVAANAPDSGDGFFSIAAHQCQIPVKPPHEDTQNTSVILDTSVQFKDEPISRRAWALQEWELAPRRLVFTSSRIHYICPHSLLDKIKMKPFFPMYTPWLQREGVFASFWDGLVQNYSSRNLTNPADRLPAIEGMAREFDTLLNGRLGRYLAGLWHKQLERSLLWRQGGALDIFLPKSQKSRPEKWVAPSWSWASVQGSVDFAFAQTGESLVDIIGAETTLNSPGNPYGRVTSGSLTISGPCLATRAAGSHGKDSDGPRWLNYKDEWVGYIFLDADQYSQEHHEVLRSQDTLYFLGLRSERHPEQVGENVRGLILMERSPSLFYRVGAFLDRGKSSWFEGAEKRTLTIL